MSLIEDPQGLASDESEYSLSEIARGLPSEEARNLSRMNKLRQIFRVKALWFWGAAKLSTSVSLPR